MAPTQDKRYRCALDSSRFASRDAAEFLQQVAATKIASERKPQKVTIATESEDLQHDLKDAILLLNNGIPNIIYLSAAWDASQGHNGSIQCRVDWLAESAEIRIQSVAEKTADLRAALEIAQRSFPKRLRSLAQSGKDVEDALTALQEATKSQIEESKKKVEDAIAEASRNLDEGSLRYANIQSDLYIKISDLRSKIKEVEESHRVLQDYAENAVLARHAEIFAKEANKHETVARRWLIASVFLFFVFSGVAVWVALQPLDGADSILSRIVLLSVPVTGLAVTIRQYSANQHNTISLRYRSNAIAAYSAFAEAAGRLDDSAKSAMLTSATSLVFAQHDSGYARTPALPINPILLEYAKQKPQ